MSKDIPRPVNQGRQRPRIRIGTDATPQAKGNGTGTRVTPTKNSSKRRLAPPWQNMKPVSTAAYIHDQPAHQHRRRWRSSPPYPSPTLHISSKSRHWGKTPIRPLSRLESLPTEILESIFFYALALGIGGAFLNLPRASVHLGRKLSSDYVRRELFLQMCSDPQPSQSHRHYQTLTRFHEEHARTQTWILRQQWFTHDFVRDCIPDYLVSVLLRESQEHRLNWLNHDGPLVHAGLEPIIRRYVLSHLEIGPASPGSPNTRYLEHQWEEPAPSKRHIILGLSPPTGFVSLMIYDNNNPPLIGSEGLDNPHFHGRWRIISLNPATRIPNHLLHGPWAVPKIELLELLIRGGASVDWVHTTSGEIAERGFYDALQENNARALRALCICDNDTTPGERKDASYTIIPSHGVGVIPSQEHLLVAIDQGCQEDVVETLLNAPESECDLQDVQVVKAIYEMEKRGWLKRATWLAERRDTDRYRRNVRTGKQNRKQLGGPLNLRGFNPL